VKKIPKDFALRLILGRSGKITKFRAFVYWLIWCIVWLLRLDVPKPKGPGATFLQMKILELEAKIRTIKLLRAQGKN
jgi:hypothetical protein